MSTTPKFAVGEPVVIQVVTLPYSTRKAGLIYTITEAYQDEVNHLWYYRASRDGCFGTFRECDIMVLLDHPSPPAGTLKLIVGDYGDPSTGINPNQWELTLPLTDALDNSYSRTPEQDLPTSKRLQELVDELTKLYADFNDGWNYCDVEVNGKFITREPV